jgi:hypothetical protein
MYSCFVSIKHDVSQTNCNIPSHAACIELLLIAGSGALKTGLHAGCVSKGITTLLC